MCLVDAISRIQFYLILFHLLHLKETYLLRNNLHIDLNITLNFILYVNLYSRSTR